MDALPGRLAAVASLQHAVITLGQLCELDVTRHQRERLLASGQLRRIHRGVYQLTGIRLTWQGRVAAARFALGPDAMASHRSAAALYGLEGFAPQQVVHVSIPACRSPRKPPNVHLHRCHDYHLIAPQMRQNILVTDPARLILDLYAAERNVDVARRGLFSARKKNLVTWTALADSLERHARPGRRGIARLRADLELYGRVGCPESPFEEALRKLLTGAGLPEPALQHPVMTPGGRYRIDVAYPEFRVGVEGKSRAHHLTDEAFESDPVRDADLAIAGWIIIHVTWAQLQADPAGVVRRVRRALLSRDAVIAA